LAGAIIWLGLKIKLPADQIVRLIEPIGGSTATDRITVFYFGNLFIMSVHPEGYGQVYFWDHEGEPEIQDGTYTDNCSFVAYSFSEFINSLVG